MHIFFQNNQYLGSYYFTRSADDPVPVNAGGMSTERSRKGSSVLLLAWQVRQVTQDWSVPPNTAVTTELDWDQSEISIQDSTNQRRVFTWERSEECSDSRILWSTHGSRCSSSVCSLSTNHSSVFRLK